MVCIIRVTNAMGMVRVCNVCNCRLLPLELDTETIIFQSMRQRYWNDSAIETSLLESQQKSILPVLTEFKGTQINLLRF